jgi:stress-induced morphogen
MPRHATSCFILLDLLYLINQDSVIQYLAATEHLHRRIQSRMAEGSQHGGHPIVKSIEEKLRAAITVEHFVCHLPPCPSRRKSPRATLTTQEIVDTSGNCGGSYSVVVVSPDFRKKMTLARHKLGKWIHRSNGHCREIPAVVVYVAVEAGCGRNVSRGIILDIQGGRMRRCRLQARGTPGGGSLRCKLFHAGPR